MSTVLGKLLTAEELLAMGDIGRCELIFGELVMMSPAGAEHGWVAGRLHRVIANFVEENELGYVFSAETGFKLATDPDLVRAADVGFVRAERLNGPLPKGFFEGPPDLAVEVISPGDTRREVAEKVNAWLAHGAQSCWVVDPLSMTLTIHRTAQQPIRLGENQTLSNDPVLAGFSVQLRKIFKRP